MTYPKATLPGGFWRWDFCEAKKEDIMEPLRIDLKSGEKILFEYIVENHFVSIWTQSKNESLERSCYSKSDLIRLFSRNKIEIRLGNDTVTRRGNKLQFVIDTYVTDITIGDDEIVQIRKWLGSPFD